MKMCRACLKWEGPLVPLDDYFVHNYNLLTNLSIILRDEFPQFLCEPCVGTIKLFINFRQTCIKSEEILQTNFIESSFKSENIPYTIKVEPAKNELNNENRKVTECEIKVEITNSYDDFTSTDCFTGSIFGELDAEIPYFIKAEKKKSKLQKSNVKLRLVKENKCSKVENDKIRDQRKIKNVKEHKCGLCVQTFPDSTLLAIHVETHSKDTKCGLCTTRFDSWPQLLSHRIIHAKQHFCHLCHKRCINPISLEHHFLKTHSNGEYKGLKCNECNSWYATPRKLRVHIKESHSTKIFICDTCSKVFSTKQKIKKHFESHLQKKKYVCDLCGFSCKNRQGLVTHKIRHSLKKVICRKCERPFEDKEHLERHKCTDKAIVCPVCGKQFNRTNKFSRHMITHSAIGKHKCDRCPAVYKSSGALKVHKDKHDGNRTKQCEYCQAKFYSASVLIKHRRVHTGEKPYVCEICHKGFTGGHNLKVHMKVHGKDLVNKKERENTSNNLFTSCF